MTLQDVDRCSAAPIPIPLAGDVAQPHRIMLPPSPPSNNSTHLRRGSKLHLDLPIGRFITSPLPSANKSPAAPASGKSTPWPWNSLPSPAAYWSNSPPSWSVTPATPGTAASAFLSPLSPPDTVQSAETAPTPFSHGSGAGYFPLSVPVISAVSVPAPLGGDPMRAKMPLPSTHARTESMQSECTEDGEDLRSRRGSLLPFSPLWDDGERQASTTSVDQEIIAYETLGFMSALDMP